MGRPILAQNPSLIVYQRDATGDTFKNGIHFLWLPLGLAVQPCVLQCHGCLRCQANQQNLVIVREPPWLCVTEQQTTAHMSVAIKQRHSKETADNWMPVRHP